MSFANVIPWKEFRDIVKLELDIDLATEADRTKHIPWIISTHKQLLVDEVFDFFLRNHKDFYETVHRLDTTHLQFVVRYLGIKIEKQDDKISLLVNILITHLPNHFELEEIFELNDSHYEIKWKRIDQPVSIPKQIVVQPFPKFSDYILSRKKRSQIADISPRPTKKLCTTSTQVI